MRFDRFRRRMPSPANPLPSSPSPPAYINHQEDISSVSASPSLRASHCASQQPESTPTTRSSYIRALEARMEQMEKVPTSSFYHSYAGEFDMLLSEDRKAIRKMHEFETSTRVENAHRNRYANILSNERTRVKLQDIAPGENDYINANLVTGHHDHPGYIATQAPLPETTPHFWQMVYESVSPIIIMLTKVEEEHCEITKSEQYWPAVGENLLFRDYMVHGVSERSDAVNGVIERRFQVGRVVDKRKKHARDLVDADSLIPPGTDSSVWQTPLRGRTHTSTGGDDDDDDCEDNEELLRNLELIGPVLEVVQLQYIAWPDQNVPAAPHTLLDLCNQVDKILCSHRASTTISAPPVVHCSAGVGRTGTFIAVDRTLRRLWDAFEPPNFESRQGVQVEEIRDLVRKLKNERSKMVQTPEQYRFIYEAVLSAMQKWQAGESLFGDSPQANGDKGGESDCRDRLRTNETR